MRNKDQEVNFTNPLDQSKNGLTHTIWCTKGNQSPSDTLAVHTNRKSYVKCYASDAKYKFTCSKAVHKILPKFYTTTKRLCKMK